MSLSPNPAPQTPDYVAWRNMIARCVDPYNRRWPSYGGAGVKVCDRWRNFEAFHEDMGRRPEGHVLARRIKTGDYTPENCFWESREECARRHRPNLAVTYGGETLDLAEWARRTGLRKGTIRNRLLTLGWSAGQALGFEPVRSSRPISIMTYKGETLPLIEWARRNGLRTGTVRARLALGWSVGQALGLEPRWRPCARVATAAGSFSQHP